MSQTLCTFSTTTFLQKRRGLTGWHYFWRGEGGREGNGGRRNCTFFLLRQGYFFAWWGKVLKWLLLLFCFFLPNGVSLSANESCWSAVLGCGQLLQVRLGVTRFGQVWPAEIKCDPDVTRCDSIDKMWIKSRCDQVWPDVTRCDQMWPGVTLYHQMWLGLTRCD